MKKATRFRRLIEAEEILVQPVVYDGFSARLVQQIGFAAGSISGAGLSESNLGWADVGLMGYEENLHASRAIAASVDIPLSADGDTGYGNAINVFFTVRGFEAAGVDGLMLEDQVWPKRCGHMSGKEVISAEEGVEKIRAAVEARRDPDFIIKARTDAMATHGVKEAIRRLNLYAKSAPICCSPMRCCRATTSPWWRARSPSRCRSTWAWVSARVRQRLCCRQGNCRISGSLSSAILGW